MNCAVCGGPIESIKGVAYEITGWEESREAGGTNHVLLRQRTGRIMCKSCKQKKVLGLNENQMELV